jgi:hypothetical protein
MGTRAHSETAITLERVGTKFIEAANWTSMDDIAVQPYQVTATAA